MQRLPFLPLANAYVTENGGRIFLLDHSLPTAAPFLEDTDWRQRHAHVGVPLLLLSNPAAAVIQ